MDKQIIKKNISNILTETDFKGLGERKVGKVRDSYFSKDQVIMITTDRQSAFDRVLTAIPFKGQVLNQASVWWFKKTAEIIPNYVLEVPDPNVTIGKRCEVFPFEMVVRGYLTGSTSTSIWVNYEKGERRFGGITLLDNMKKNVLLPKNIITPSTKFEEHDRNITSQDIIGEGMASKEDWDYIGSKALELFSFGQRIAKEHGLILVDTKYEFGRDKEGNIILIDEIHTPDSSRYWLADTYKENIAAGKEPDNIDKEFLRLWFKDHCDPYNDKELPEAPEDLVVELAGRYIKLYEMITGQPFKFSDQPISQRLEENLRQAGYLVK